MAPKSQVAAFLALCLVSAVAARDTFVLPVEESAVETVAKFNEELSTFEFVNQTVVSRRQSMDIGQSIQVSVTFYNSPGMDCTTGERCGSF